MCYYIVGLIYLNGGIIVHALLFTGEAPIWGADPRAAMNVILLAALCVDSTATADEWPMVADTHMKRCFDINSMQAWCHAVLQQRQQRCATCTWHWLLPSPCARCGRRIGTVCV